MYFLEMILLAAVQGLTEFLPISSSGHLYLLETFFGTEPDLFLAIWLHAASLLAVMWFFRQRIVSLFRGLFGNNSEQGVALKLMLSTLLTFPLALLVKELFIDEGFLSLSVVGITLILTGVFIIISEKLAGTRTGISWLDSIIVGLAQGVSVIPGISRSGTTIATLVSMGVSKKSAAEYSFLLSIPTILAAFLLGLYEYRDTVSQVTDVSYLVPFVITVIVSYVTIRYMMKLIEKHWIYFAPYCLILGAILVIL